MIVTFLMTLKYVILAKRRNRKFVYIYFISIQTFLI
jgi:hypothetical protein